MKLKAKWEFASIPIGKSSQNPLLLQLETPPTSGTSRKLVVVLALDKSWSMKGAKMQSVSDAAILFLNWLTRNDYLGVVTYAEDVKVVQRPLPLTEKTVLADKIRSIKLGTSTNLSGGWVQALRLAEDVKEESATKRVILLTDGQATTGVREEDKLVELARQYAKLGIHTSTIGVGSDFSEKGLRDIARAGEGNFHFIETPEQAADIFYREFGDIRALHAQAPEIRFFLPPEAKLKNVLADADIDQMDDGVVVRTGDIPADDRRSIVFDFTMEKPSQDIAISGELVYLNVVDGMKEERIKFKIPVKVSNSPGERNSQVAEEFVIAFTAREMERISGLAAKEPGLAATEITQLQKVVESLMTEKNCRPAWLLDSLKSLSDKLKGDTNMGGKRLLAESSKLFRDSARGKTKATEKEVLRTALQGNLDMYKVPEFNENMTKQLAGGIRFIVLDFSECGFIDSSAIGALIQLSNSLIKRGGMLIVHDVQSGLRKLFTATKLDQFVPVAENSDEADKLIPRE